MRDWSSPEDPTSSPSCRSLSVWQEECSFGEGFRRGLRFICLTQVHQLERCGLAIGAGEEPEFVVGSGSREPTALEHENAVGAAKKAQPIGDQESGSSGHGV